MVEAAEAAAARKERAARAAPRRRRRAIRAGVGVPLRLVYRRLSWSGFLSATPASGNDGGGGGGEEKQNEEGGLQTCPVFRGGFYPFAAETEWTL